VLEEHFPLEFGPPPHDDGYQVMDKIEEQLSRLSPLCDKVVEIEELNVESKISAAALPALTAVDKLTRYETSIDRALDRALRRLEAMQASRRKAGEATAEK
jgi:hypothetical protein